jgi:hypothetical protein
VEERRFSAALELFLIQRGAEGAALPRILVTKGISSGTAIAAARGIQIPETDQQRNWIDHYAAILASAK